MNSKIRNQLFLSLLTTALLLIGGVVTAQNSFKARNQFGFKGGASLGNIRLSPPTISQGMKLGYLGGFVYRHKSEKYFGLQTELTFNQYGWQEKTDLIANVYTRTLNAVELPFMTHVYIPMGKYANFFVNLGPQVYYIFSDSESRNNIVSENALYGKSVENRFNYGIVGGGGLELDTRAGVFGIEARYFFGLSDIFNNAKKEPFQASSPQLIQVSIHYLLP